MVGGPLSNDQIDEFIERGWTLLRRAFAPAVARALRRDLGERIGIDLERPEQWTKPGQALLNLFCFSTVDLGGGGTLLVEGSHHMAARILWEAEPGGLEADDFDKPLTAILDEKGWPGVVEAVAEEGDVVLAHPLLFHSSNPNHGTRPRVMAQPAFRGITPKRVEGDDLCPIEVPLARTVGRLA